MAKKNVLTFKEKLEGLNQDVKELWERAYHDSLTGLLNRAALEDVMVEQLGKLGLSQVDSFALLFMDLNGFKSVNDTFKHEVGDELLKEVAERLKELHGEFAFRLGGDEFVVILPRCADISTAERQAETIRTTLEMPYVATDNQRVVAPSIGITFCDDRTKYDLDNEVAQRRIKDEADEAMYAAKLISKTSLRANLPHQSQTVSGFYLSSGSTLNSKDFRTSENKDIFLQYKGISRNGFGNGRLISKDGEINCNFEFLQFSDGEMRIFVLSLPPSANNTDRHTRCSQAIVRHESVSFEGSAISPKTDGKCAIFIQNASPLTSNWQSQIGLRSASLYANQVRLDFATGLVAKIRFYVGNLTFPTDFIRPDEPLNLNVGPFVVCLNRLGTSKEHEGTIKELRETKDFAVTCFADTSLNSPFQVESAVDCMKDVCWLLSFLHGSRVNWLSYDLLTTEGELLKSECQNPSQGILKLPNAGRGWSLSLLETSIPKMYANLPNVQAPWNLINVLSFLNHALTGGHDFLEIQGYKIFQCVEMLVYAHRKQKVGTVNEGFRILNTVDFNNELFEMCKELKLESLCKEGESQDEGLKRIVSEVIALRESLTSEGVLNLAGESEKQLGSERIRRVDALYEFVRQCVLAILIPSEPHTIGPLNWVE